MKPQDLRIGNYFMDDEGFFSQVTGFYPFEHSTRCDEDEGCYILLDQHLRKNLECESFNCKPIPLTEEWLLNFGFIKKIGNHGEYYAHNKYSGFRVWKSNATSCWVIGRKQFDNNSTYWIVDLKNVNQIQNLFYDLTGEELKATL